MRTSIVVVLSLGVTLAAEAAPKSPRRGAAKPAASTLPRAELDRLIAALGGDEIEPAVAAAKRLGASGDPQAAVPLIEVLALGTLPEIAAASAEALGGTKDRRAVSVLLVYAGNRNAPVRAAAVKALASIDDPQANEVLIDRLGDADARVRAAAAAGVAARKIKSARDRLHKLVARNDAGAAAPLGTLIEPGDIPRLAELQGRVDEAVLATVFGEFLRRADAPDRLRVDVVRTLGRMTGAAATAELVKYLAAVPDNENRPSKEDAQKILEGKGEK